MIRALLQLTNWVAPRDAHAWTQAMQAEVAAIADPRAARRFALGCLWAAVIFRLRSMFDVRTQHISSRVVPARLLFIQANCGCAAAAIGILYLVAAKAPLPLIIVNTVAMLMGVVLAGASPHMRLSSRLATGATVAIAGALLLTAAFGHAVDGVSRWVQVGPLFVQTSLVLLPVAVLLFAHTVNRFSTMAMIAIALAVALQPDRAMAAALCAGLLALLLVRRTRAVAIACSAAVVAVLITWLQADHLPAVPFVDHILWSSFNVHPMIAVALWVGSALLFVPLLVIPSADARSVCVACGACWGAIVVAAIVGAYPTPVVGYGGAAVLGYFFCLAALGAQTRRTDLTTRTAVPASNQHARDTHQHAELSRVRVFRGVAVASLFLTIGSRRASAQKAADECARPPVPKVEGPGVWQPGPTGKQLPLWPEGYSLLRPESGGRPEYIGNGSPLVAGKTWNWATYVARPTMTIYQPSGVRSGAAIVVLPGGGYAAVAMDLEGTEICDWITTQGITCVLLKYRVPQVWPRDARGVGHPPSVQLPLQDAQRAIGLLRARASEYGINAQKIGVIGFSAGGHLAAAVSNAEQRTYVATDAADRASSIPNFAILLYPGRLWDNLSRNAGLPLASWVTISRKAPPTLLIHAMNDPVDNVRHSAAYGLALHEAGVPVDVRFYAKGCHAFGLRKTSDPITTEWPGDVVRWLRGLGILTTAAK